MGEMLYAPQCAGCHGADLDGGVGPALRGRALLPQSRAKAPTAADLDIWIRANMPVSAPGSLSRAESLAITEYVMRRNGRYGSATAMTAETATRQDRKSAVEGKRGEGRVEPGGRRN